LDDVTFALPFDINFSIVQCLPQHPECCDLFIAISDEELDTSRSTLDGSCLVVNDVTDGDTDESDSHFDGVECLFAAWEDDDLPVTGGTLDD